MSVSDEEMMLDEPEIIKSNRFGVRLKPARRPYMIRADIETEIVLQVR